VTISGAIPRPTAVVRAALPHAVRPGLVSVAPQIAPVMPLNGRAKICKYFMKGWWDLAKLNLGMSDMSDMLVWVKRFQIRCV